MTEASRLEQSLRAAERERFDAAAVVRGCVEGYRLAYPQAAFALELPRGRRSRSTARPDLARADARQAGGERGGLLRAAARRSAFRSRAERRAALRVETRDRAARRDPRLAVRLDGLAARRAPAPARRTWASACTSRA